MRRDDHTHTLEIEIAEKADVLEGTNQTKFVVPSSLGTAAAFDSDFFATAEQGRKIDEVHARLNDAHTKATEAKKTSDEIVQTAREAKASADAAVATANEAKQTVEDSKVDILLNKKSIQDLKAASADKPSVEKIVTKVTELDRSFRDLGALARKNSVALEDLNIGGTRDGDHVLSGTGWVPKQAELSEEDREKIAKVDEIEEAVQLLRDCCKVQPAAAVLDVGLQERVEQVETQISDVEEKVTTNANEISDIKQKAEEARQKAIAADAKILALEVLSTDSGQAKKAMDAIEAKMVASQTVANEAKDACNAAKALSEQNKGRVEALTGTINQVERKVDDSISKSSRAEATAATANTSALEAGNRASEAKTAAEEARTKVGEITNKLGTVEAASNDLKTRVDGFDERITQATTKAEEAKQCCAEIAEVKNGVEQAKGIANAAQTAARNANSAITAAGVNAENALKKATDAENKATEVNTKVVELEAKVKKCSDDLSTAQADLESKIDHNKDDVTEAKTTAESARKTADASKAITDALSPRMTAVEGKATTLEGKVTAIEGKVTTVEGKVEELEKRPAGGGNVEFYEANKMDDQTEFEKLISANHKKVEDVRKQVGLPEHVTAGMDNSQRWIAVKGYDKKPSAWMKDLKDVVVQVTDSTVHTLYHQDRLSYLEDVVNMGNVTLLSRSKPFLQAKPNERRKIVLKAGTLISVDLGHKKGHLVFNTDHDISHGVGVAQRMWQAGFDYFVLALVDWDSPTQEVTFTIQTTTTPPAGYDASSAILLGGFHTLCSNAGVLDKHPLNGFSAGDILPESVWCLNHRPKCSPAGMVYHKGRDFWADIYFTSVSAPHGLSSRSRFQGTISVLSRNDFTTKLLASGKRLPTDEEFICLVEGTPVGSKMTSKASTAGAHRGSNGKRIISNIGVEDGFGVYSTFLSNVCTVYNPNAAGGAKHEMRTFAAGGSYAIPSPGIWHRNGGLLMTNVINMMAGRGVCGSRTW